jgi:hypothetical protein
MDDTPHPIHRAPKAPPHYYGDIVRGLFLAAAIIMLIAGFAGAALPMPTGLSIVWIVILVLIAGITSPVQRWIHWMNVAVSIIGLVIFGGAMLNQYHGPASVFAGGIFLALLTLIFLLSLYFATRTLRNAILFSRPIQAMHPHIPN